MGQDGNLVLRSGVGGRMRPKFLRYDQPRPKGGYRKENAHLLFFAAEQGGKKAEGERGTRKKMANR